MRALYALESRLALGCDMMLPSLCASFWETETRHDVAIPLPSPSPHLGGWDAALCCVPLCFVLGHEPMSPSLYTSLCETVMRHNVVDLLPGSDWVYCVHMGV